MRVLVTGGAGFLGLYLTEQLVERGDHVRCLCRGSYQELTALGVETVQGDLRDAQRVLTACEGCDIVFHTAGMAGIWGPKKTFFDINTRGTQNIIEACWKNQVPRLVYTSSPSVTFDGTDQNGVNESAPYPSEWLCHYPHSKAIAEQQVLAANGQRGLLTCALRPHLIWGPRDRHLIPRLLERARHGKLRRVGDGRNLVDMIYVENAADAHVLAAAALLPNAPVCGQAYFISQGEPVNCWDWINDILALANLPPITKSISLSSAWRIGSALETAYRIAGIQREPRMTRFLAAQLATNHFFDISRARQDFGYRTRISTETGMQRLKNALKSEDCVPP